MHAAHAPTIRPAQPDVTPLRRLHQRFQAGGLTLHELLTEVRSRLYSVRVQERGEAVRLLASLDHVDAARELMTLFRECEWRATRLAIVRALGRRPFQRSLEFLMKIAAERTDLPLAEAAVHSLGGSRQPFAGRFLAQLYRHGPPVLRPAIVGALAQIPDRCLVPELLEALPKALRQNDRLFSRQLILALSELKAPGLLPLVLPLLGEDTDAGLRSCALVAIGKLSRDPDSLDAAESGADPLEQQILLTARSQVQLRSAWSIEDYLVKIFEEPTFSPTLPLELDTFPEDEIEAGLDLFRERRHVPARIATLARVDHPRVFDWYTELAALPDLTPAELDALLLSLQAHSDKRATPALRLLEATCLADATAPLFRRWLETAALCLPRGDAELARVMISDRYPSFPRATKVELINHLANYALSGAPDARVTKRVAVQLEQALYAETDPHVQGRLVRALGQIEVCGPRVLAWITTNRTRADLLPSGLQLLECVAPKAGVEILLSCIRDPMLARRHCAAIFRALRTQPGELPTDAPELDTLIAWALDGAGPEERLAALRCLAAHPRRAHLRAIEPLLLAEERVQMAAVLAVKGIGSPDSAELLAPLLCSASESVVGRTVDALSALPGARAVKLLLGVLQSHLENHELCDKIVRAMQPPPGNRGDIVSALDTVIQQNADHPLIEGLYGLRDRMTATGSQPDQTLGIEVPRLDAELARRIRGYVHLDEQVKVTLRAAELPFYRPELFRGQLDKSTSVLSYCKAIDLYLGARLGERLLFPQLQKNLYEFQRIVHTAGLGEDVPSRSRVTEFFGLDNTFRQQGSPIHKMSLVAQGILSGKILMGEQWKVLDGLRAWAAVLILFGNDLPPGGPRGSGVRALLPMKVERAEVLRVAEGLFELQDLRNPVAHRQTMLGFPAIDRARADAEQLLNSLGTMLG